MFIQRLLNHCTGTLCKNKFSFRQIFSNSVPIFKHTKPYVIHNQTRFVCNSSRHVSFKNLSSCCQIGKRSFSSKPPKHSWGLPMIVWIIILPFLQVGTMIMGMNLRRWWLTLPVNKMDHILRLMRLKQEQIILSVVVSNGIVYAFYKSHQVEDPITKRKKFLLFSETQMREMAMSEYKFLMERYKNNISTSGKQYNNVLHVSQQILRANRHLPGTKRDWKVIIIDDKTLNAFVLPSGHIFIFTGLLTFVDSNHQLATVIGHEIAHVLLNHGAENISKTVVLNLVMLLPLLAICTLFPDLKYYSLAITEYIGTILFHLPFSRQLELEADIVGLEMMSRACYDPQQARLLWAKMQKVEPGKQSQWLSTHPSHEIRQEKIKQHMSKALDIFKYNCKNDMYPHYSK